MKMIKEIIDLKPFKKIALAFKKFMLVEYMLEYV